MSRKPMRFRNGELAVDERFYVPDMVTGVAFLNLNVHFTVGFPIFGSGTRLERWLAWREAFERPSDKTLAINSLSDEVMKVNLLLMEWWKAEEKIPDNALIKHLAQDSDPESPPIPLPNLDGQNYRRALYHLWIQEFYNDSARGTEKALLLRQSAAEIAAVHRTAQAFQTKPDAQCTSSRSTLRVIDSPVSACFTPCPWLNYNEWKGEMPYYLWDIQAGATVRCPPGHIDYLVISHTWGRWRIGDQSVQLKGVPWLVPSNTIFNVEDLPSILSGVPFDTRYIWFDLVCIPQDGSELQGVEISRQAAIFKSAKWATIWFNRLRDFSGLRAALAWASHLYLSDINSYDIHSRWPTSRAHLAKAASQTTGLASFVDDEDGLSADRLHFPWHGDGPKKHMIPDGWFSSLWTLQEACLRPDLYLCNQHWEVFAPENSSTTAVPLDHIIALINSTVPAMLQSNDVPLATHELLGIFTTTSMHKLLEMSPIDLLTFGNQRHCQDTNRAAAIMSALGTTNWYQEYRQRTGHEKVNDLVSTLVQDKYPLEFLNEVRDKFGGLLFAVCDISNLMSNHYRFGWWWKKLVKVKLAATMMPFTRDIRRNRAMPIPNLALGIYNDPAVEDWVINNDGSVDMDQAGVMAACPRRNLSPVAATIHVMVPRGKHGGNGTRFKGDVDLTVWLSSFRPRSEKLAVCLLRHQVDKESLFLGMLLERVYTGKKRRDFMKFGTFWLLRDRRELHNVPPREAVNLKVL